MKRQNRLLFLLLTALGLTILLTTQSEREKARVAQMPLRVPAAPAPKPKAPVIKYPMRVVESFPFSDPNALDGWEEKVFKGRVRYGIEKDKDASYVRAASDSAASALYYKVRLDPRQSPVISWKWRVDKFPKKARHEVLETQDEHDFAGRVYVIFPAFFILNSKVLEYIWSETLPIGETGTSPYSGNIKLTVLESGPAKDGEWRFEERDIVADYIKAFGAPPDRDIGAISFMTNAEHTSSAAEAVYDDIKVGYKESIASKNR
jgi:hypothetical protein